MNWAKLRSGKEQANFGNTVQEREPIKQCLLLQMPQIFSCIFDSYIL